MEWYEIAGYSVKQLKRIDEEKNSAVAQMKLSVEVKPEIEATNYHFVHSQL